MCRQSQTLRFLTLFTWPATVMLFVLVPVGEAASPKPSPSPAPVLEFKVEAPQTPVSLQAFNSRAFTIAFKIRNRSDQEVVVWPFLQLQVIGPDGRRVDRALNRGRFGFSAGSIIESINFVAIPAGKTHEIKINLRSYEYDLMTMTGWRIEKPGTYTLKMQYEFDRKAAKKTLGQGCKDLDHAHQPWNRAVKVKKTATVKVKVK